MIHQLNILLHIGAGTLAVFLGVAALLTRNQSLRHIRIGRYFLCFLAIVVSTGFLGWLFFRSNNFLVMLTILSGYVGYAGWRTIILKEQRASISDALTATLAFSVGLLFLINMPKEDAAWNPAVIYTTLGALGLVTFYDLSKYLWLYNFFKKWWIYEHIYKMISAFSALLSAFAGTVLPDFKPYSQLGPSTFCFLLIISLIWREAAKSKRKYKKHVPG